ncbi:SAM-dependent methyltransferase [Saccharomonospora cyanea]|uniref:Methyltransferase family protein n=1 Tax=Saccharomonospora cyanea NA-134 TaxID=882082 RepID=H5XJY4_9PSEU|nr:class I SAM-dependent methyltransferase [Saccharomonospora cyanea]EHR61901.1 methyltransferase family protein [Saccharomonospora cyanea NA-134]
MGTGASDRLSWAVGTLGLRPTDRVLEVGCGPGVAVSLVCELLTDGHVTAIDRSEAMTAAAARRNARHIAEGRADVRTTPLAEAGFDHERFDVVFAVRVGVFSRGEPTRELTVVRDHLAPGGRLVLVEQPPTAERLDEAVDTLTRHLVAHGFVVHDVVRAEPPLVPGASVISTPV